MFKTQSNQPEVLELRVGPFARKGNGREWFLPTEEKRGGGSTGPCGAVAVMPEEDDVERARR